jgi:hypothetical protein
MYGLKQQKIIIEKVLKIQNRLLRIILHSKYLDYTDPLFRCHNMLKLDSIYKYSLLVLTYKIKYWIRKSILIIPDKLIYFIFLF